MFACFKAELKSTLASLTRKERKENKSHKSSGGQNTGLKILDPLQKGLLLACVYLMTLYSPFGFRLLGLSWGSDIDVRGCCGGRGDFI